MVLAKENGTSSSRRQTLSITMGTSMLAHSSALAVMQRRSLRLGRKSEKKTC